MKRMVFYFEKPQSLAPTTALKKSVTAMLKLTKADLTTEPKQSQLLGGLEARIQMG